MNEHDHRYGEAYCVGCWGEYASDAADTFHDWATEAKDLLIERVRRQECLPVARDRILAIGQLGMAYRAGL